MAAAFFHDCEAKKENNDYSGSAAPTEEAPSLTAQQPQVGNEGGNKTEDKDRNEQEVLEENSETEHPAIGVHHLRPREDHMWKEVKT